MSDQNTMFDNQPGYQNGGSSYQKSAKKDDYEMKTKGGYDLKLVRSAIQKAVRRGAEEEALYWAAEMHEGGFTNYLLTTMACIQSEDIGWADAGLSAAVDAKIVFGKMLYAEKKGKAEYTPMLASVILMMCRARKTRAADNAWQYMAEKRKAGFRIQLPDVCEDEHTQAGRAKGRWWRFWVAQGARLQNMATPEEIGGTDYQKSMDEYWGRGHVDHKDEPHWNVWDEKNPNAPIRKVGSDEFWKGLGFEANRETGEISSEEPQQ